MVGVGIDIVDIGRIARLIEKYGVSFMEKVFTPNEILYCKNKAYSPTHFAGRWAVKEAFYKALPQSCQPYSTWKSIEIVPQPQSRKPEIIVLNEKLRNALKCSNIGKIHVSISHEQKFCTAVVFLE